MDNNPVQIISHVAKVAATLGGVAIFQFAGLPTYMKRSISKYEGSIKVVNTHGEG